MLYPIQPVSAVIALKERKSTLTSPVESVHHLFARIAEILLKLGIDAPGAERTLRAAFVDAAKKRFTESGIRLTQSQIASMTGISRLEVRNFLKQVAPRGRQSASRVEQLVSGWRSDSRYLDHQGRPKVLRLKGQTASFETLAKCYGRDVTPKALRAELIRRGLATVKDQKIQLEKSSRSNSQQFISAHSDLRFLISYLAGYDLPRRRRSYAIRREVVPVSSAKNASVIRQLAIDRFQTVLNSITELSTKSSLECRRSTSSSRRILFTTVVATEGKD